SKVVEVEKKTGRKIGVVIVLGLIVAAGLAAAGYVLLQKTESRLRESMQAISVAAEDSRADYEKNVKLLARAQEESQKELARLSGEYAKLRETSDPDDEELKKVREEIEALREELEGRRSLEEKFAQVQKDADSALFLIGCRVKVSARIFRDSAGKKTDTMWEWGTGFLVDDRGTVVTCKHVVQPWKYGAIAEILAMTEATVVETQVEAFPAGFPFDPKAAEGAGPGTARIPTTFVRAAADNLRTVSKEGIGLRYEEETDHSNDVALLRVEGAAGKPLRLATAEEFAELKKRKAWPVMVAGFPQGYSLFEEKRVTTSMTVGHVRKVERFVQHTAPTCGGNSGGPLIDSEGRVVGVVSYMHRGETIQNLNACVPVTRVHKLLSSPR
ncbi:MAG: S1 family peptidase, partial [Planctomycetota bacterium]